MSECNDTYVVIGVLEAIFLLSFSGAAFLCLCDCTVEFLAIFCVIFCIGNDGRFQC